MDPQYIDLVKKWVQLDNVIIRNNIEVKDAKEEVKRIESLVDATVDEKKRIEKEILDYVQEAKLESMQLKISDGVITFGKKTTQKPLSQKYIRDILQKYAEENTSEQMDYSKIFDYINSNVEKKIDYTINRVIKDK